MSNNIYEQTGDYMPRTDDGFWHWLQNFSSLISADPSRYAMTKADAEVIRNHFDAYTPLWTQCKQPSVRTTTLIQQKDAIKASAMTSCRVYAQIIKAVQGVCNDDKSALGLHVDDTTPTRITPPASAPMLTIAGAFSGEHVLRYADENTPTSRRKPSGAQFIEIRCNIARGPNPDVSAAALVGVYGRQPIKVELEQKHVGETATYFGRWVNTRGEPGPWSLPVTMTIAFGGPLNVQGKGAKRGEDEGNLKMAA